MIACHTTSDSKEYGNSLRWQIDCNQMNENKWVINLVWKEKHESTPE